MAGKTQEAEKNLHRLVKEVKKAKKQLQSQKIVEKTFKKRIDGQKEQIMKMDNPFGSVVD